MKVLFQTIGVLVQYNWALPYYMAKFNQTMMVLTDAFSYMMGGYYYHFKQVRRLIPIITDTGLTTIRVLPDAIYDKLIMNLEATLLHLNSPNRLTDTLLKSRIPKVFTFHGSLDKNHVKEISEAKRILTKIYNNVDAFVAPSVHSAKTIEETCGFKPLVIHNGVDIAIFNPYIVSKEEARAKLSLPRDAKIILWSGRIDPDKGLHILVRALPYIIKEEPNTMVIVKGRTINRRYLELVNALAKNVKKHILYRFGWTPNIMMIYYYKAADVYVHTSISEGFSLTLLEAMASGIPVIGRNASSIPEAIGNPRFLFNTEDELAEKIVKIFSNPSSSKTSFANFKRVLEEGFTAECAAKKYVKLYSELT
ncbi:MAG: glycosyltransferase family 4 protein [Candidatus Bathyarchaeia archaeon]